MAMDDWNDYRNQILARVGEIGKLSPDTVKGYMALSGAGATTGHLDAKPAWRRLAHEHSHAFDAAMPASRDLSPFMNNHMPVGRLTADPHRPHLHHESKTQWRAARRIISQDAEKVDDYYEDHYSRRRKPAPVPQLHRARKADLLVTHSATRTTIMFQGASCNA